MYIVETKGFNHMGCGQDTYPTEGADGTLPGSKHSFLMAVAERQSTREVQDGTVLIQAWSLHGRHECMALRLEQRLLCLKSRLEEASQSARVCFHSLIHESSDLLTHFLLACSGLSGDEASG